jgi:putative hydrolase of the HAD superfamily
MTASQTPPAGLLLDAMGTLIGLKESVGTTYAAQAHRHGLTVEAAAIDRLFPSIYDQAPPLGLSRPGRPCPKGSRNQLVG